MCSCGLVRRVMWDMAGEVGFRLGSWNQAYQFDTLYDAQIPREEAKPGDLVFWSAPYVDERKRAFRFSMVHVEIFLGGETGTQMLGSRWKRGRVGLFDTFEFKGRSWRDPTMYFCSIEPWLRGECRPRVHTWGKQNLEWCADRRSIFAPATDQAQGGEDCEEPAEDDDAGADE